MDTQTIPYTEQDEIQHELWLLSIMRTKNFQLIESDLEDNEDTFQTTQVIDSRPTVQL